MRNRFHMSGTPKNSEDEIENNDGEASQTPSSDGDEVIVDGTADPGSEMTLKSKIEALELALQEEKNLHLRALADFQNFKRRTEEQRSEISQFAVRELIIALLPVLDNFERALSASASSKSYESLIGGVELTYRQLQDFLKKQKVEAIDVEGQQFDPNYHEAVVRDEESDLPDNTIVQELQKGYKMGDRILRPSLVKVAAGK